MTNRHATRLTDLTGIVFLLLSVLFLMLGKTYAASAALIGAAYSWACTRRDEAHQTKRRIAGTIDDYSLNAAIVLLVVGAMDSFAERLARVDFGMFYSTALILRTTPRDLYNAVLQAEILRQVSGIQEHHYLTFVYPPFVALFFVPFTYFSFKTAYWLMLCCNLVLFGVTVHYLWNRLHYDRRQIQTYLLCAAAALPVYATLMLGHISFIGLLLFSLICVDWLEGRYARVGLWSGLLGYKVSLLAVPLAMLACQRQWRGFGIAVAVLCAMVAASLGLVGIEGLVDNFSLLGAMTSESLLPRMHSIRSLAYAIGLGEVGWIVLSLAMVFAVGWAFRREWDTNWTLAAMILAALSVSPYLHTYDLVIALVPLALVISKNVAISSRTQKIYVLIAFAPVCLSLWSQVSGRPLPVVPLSMAALFVYCLTRACKNAEPTGPALSGNIPVGSS